MTDTRLSSAERFIERRRAEIIAETERAQDGAGCDHREFYPVMHIDASTVLAYACCECAYAVKAMEDMG